MSSAQFHAKNHYVPEFYLKRWACEDGRVPTYRIVVSDNRVPEWTRKPVSGIAYHSHLYSQLMADSETDEIERWLDREFESPAEGPIAKAVSGGQLSPEDWTIMTRFLAAQDLRTPARLLEYLEKAAIWSQKFLREAGQVLRDEEGLARFRERFPAYERLPLRIYSEPGPLPGTIRTVVRAIIGRGSWLHALRDLLTRRVELLHQHRWTILRAPRNLSWFTSDDPVMRLNYNDRRQYNFKGVWNSPGTEFVLPLDPTHILYARVGDAKPPKRGEVMPRAKALLVRRFVAEHAHRHIFALDSPSDVALLRPRTADADMFREEARQWTELHAEQSAAERRLESFAAIPL